jgi:general nucleoside transport system permease protein
LTSFLSVRWLQANPQLNTPPRLGVTPIPILSEIPIVGPILFSHSIFVYLMFGLVIAIHVGLFYTRWGLRVRSVGEHPKAADTVGINVSGSATATSSWAGWWPGWAGPTSRSGRPAASSAR